MMESLDHRERRLTQLGDAVEELLDEGWVYWLILGKVGEPETTDIVSNVAPDTHIAILEAMLKVIRERYAKREVGKEI